jgi:hypothetical protein
VVKERDRILSLRNSVSTWDLRKAVEVARRLNRRLSLALTLTNQGAVATLKASIRRMGEAVAGRDWAGITFYQCRESGFMVMRVPPATFTEDFAALLEMAWEGKILNQGLTTDDAFYKLQRVKEQTRRMRGGPRNPIPHHRCGCGCGERIYTRARWVSGHDGRVKGWFMRGKIPQHLQADYAYWRSTGCLLKLEEVLNATPPSGNT